MKRLVLLSMAALAVCVLSCSSDDRPKPASSDGGTGNAPTNAGGEGARDAIGGAATVEGGGAASGGAPTDLPPIGMLGGLGPIAGGGAPSMGPTLCDLEASWGNPTPLATVSTAGADERLLAMTHDELSLVFERDGALMLADRASADADFGAPIALQLPTGYGHAHGLALSPDGLTLVIVKSDQSAFGELSRAQRSGAFGGSVSGGRFTAINDHNQFVHAYLSSPVLAASGKTAFFTQIAGSSSRIFRADGDDQLLTRERSEDSTTLGSDDDDAKLSLSVSADLRAVFVLDEALGHVTGLWNTAEGAPYTQAANFEGLESAFTNADCSRLYGSRTQSGSLDIVVETAE